MKRIALGVALGLPCWFGLSACAGLSAAPRSTYEVDNAQVAAVERAARLAGVGVIWINQPRKKAALAGG